jgi:ABC-type branched-subunit amino acid transport system permease subunit
MTAATINAAAPGQKPGIRARIRDFSDRHRSTTVIVGMVLFALILYFWSAFVPFSLFQRQNAWVSAFVNAGVYVLLALGLNVVVGFAGLLDLGYAAFFAIGAYTYAFLASAQFDIHLPFVLLIIIGAVVAAIFGLLLGAPTLRLRGDYLAIMTLGFGEIVPVVFQNAEDVTNGVNGIGGLDRPNILGYQFGGIEQTPYYILMATVVTITMVLLYRLQDSRTGRAWAAIREDELAASASGINTVTTKLTAFALGATTAGFAGVLNAAKLTVVSPDQFLFVVSFTVLAMIVLGGMGNIWGVAVGAFVIYIIQTVLLKSLNGFFERFPVPILADIDFVQYQFLLYGLALVAMMLFRPEGLFPSQRRRRELHAAEELAEDEELVEDAEVTSSLGAAPGSEEDQSAGGLA